MTLSTANTYSYVKRRSSLRAYIDSLAPQAEHASGDSTLYLFGDRPDNHTAWDTLFNYYRLPPFISADDATSLSFGIAGLGSGVPFHIHGAGYSETLFGRKRWLLYAPSERPPFDPNASSLSWLRAWQAGDTRIASHGPPLECTIEPGSALYFPSDWWHATLNVDESVFMSTFVNYAHSSGREAARAAELR